MKDEQNRPRGGQTGAATRQAIYVGGAVVLFVLIALFLFYPRPGLPPDEAGEEEPGVATTEAERGVAAREAIAELQAQEQPSYDDAFARGRDFQSDGRLADAQLMYFFAARGGHAEAAFQLGAMYDPTYHTPESSLMDEPDAFQAYKWYRQALEGGVQEAERRLAELREWTEERAREGDLQAEQLLIQWEQE